MNAFCEPCAMLISCPDHDPRPDQPHTFAPLEFGGPDGPLTTDWCGFMPDIMSEDCCGRMADDPVHMEGE